MIPSIKATLHPYFGSVSSTKPKLPDDFYDVIYRLSQQRIRQGEKTLPFSVGGFSGYVEFDSYYPDKPILVVTQTPTNLKTLNSYLLDTCRNVKDSVLEIGRRQETLPFPDLISVLKTVYGLAKQELTPT